MPNEAGDTRERLYRKRFERAADYVFLAALTGVSVVGVLIAYEVI